MFDCGRTDGQTFLLGLLGHLSGNDLIKQEMTGGRGISWIICKSFALRPTPAVYPIVAATVLECVDPMSMLQAC